MNSMHDPSQHVYASPGEDVGMFTQRVSVIDDLSYIVFGNSAFKSPSSRRAVRTGAVRMLGWTEESRLRRLFALLSSYCR